MVWHGMVWLSILFFCFFVMSKHRTLTFPIEALREGGNYLSVSVSEQLLIFL